MVEGIVFFRIAAAGGKGPIAVELNHPDRPELVEGHHCEHTLNYLMCKFFLIPGGVSEGFQSYVHRRNHADAFGYGETNFVVAMGKTPISPLSQSRSGATSNIFK